MLRSRLAVLLLSVSLLGCNRDRPRSLVLEGAMPPELQLRASISLSAHRNTVFCKGFLLQNPTPKSTGRDARFERLPGNRYRASIDLRDAPHGGFCDWGVTMLGVGIDAVRDPRLLSDLPMVVKPEPYNDYPSLPSSLTIRCRYDQNGYDRSSEADLSLRCDPLHYGLKFRGDMRVEVNVRLDPTWWYPPEWDKDPSLRPPGWLPGDPTPIEVLP